MLGNLLTMSWLIPETVLKNILIINTSRSFKNIKRGAELEMKMNLCILGNVQSNKYKRRKGMNKEMKLVSFWSFDFFIHWSMPHFCQLSICYKSAKEKTVFFPNVHSHANDCTFKKPYPQDMIKANKQETRKGLCKFPSSL